MTAANPPQAATRLPPPSFGSLRWRVPGSSAPLGKVPVDSDGSVIVQLPAGRAPGPRHPRRPGTCAPASAGVLLAPPRGESRVRRLPRAAQPCAPKHPSAGNDARPGTSGAYSQTRPDRPMKLKPIILLAAPLVLAGAGRRRADTWMRGPRTPDVGPAPSRLCLLRPLPPTQPGHAAMGETPSAP